MAKTPIRKPKDVSLRYILETQPRKVPGNGCKTCGVLSELTDDDAEALRAFLADRSVPTNQIVLALGRFGQKISVSAVSRHRRECP